MLSKSTDKVADMEQGLLRGSEAWRLNRLNPGINDSDDHSSEGMKLLDNDENISPITSTPPPPASSSGSQSIVDQLIISEGGGGGGVGGNKNKFKKGLLSSSSSTATSSSTASSSSSGSTSKTKTASPTPPPSLARGGPLPNGNLESQNLANNNHININNNYNNKHKQLHNLIELNNGPVKSPSGATTSNGPASYNSSSAIRRPESLPLSLNSGPRLISPLAYDTDGTGGGGGGAATVLKSNPTGFNTTISLLHGHYSPTTGANNVTTTITSNSIGYPNGTSNGTNNNNSPKLSRIRMSSKFGRVRKRVVFKNGECNLHQTNISKRRRRYLADIFTTLVDIQWRWTLLIFTLSFLLSWLSFAMVWWLIAFTHGDLEIDHLPDRQEETSWKPCIGNFFGFTSAFLFSIETQHTIGYGSRYTTEECPEAVFVMCMQSILGVMIQAFMVGVVFAKMSRPKKRTQTLVFSRNGVICQRDGQLCLMFRVGDMRRSHIISANVRAQLIKRRVTAEGEILPFYQHELKVGVDSDQSDIFFIWPMIVLHRIDKDSPLYTTSAEELLREKFEIVLILEGVIESTGATTQARSSYLPQEILWGHRFESLVGFRKDVGEYTVDYSSFNNTYEVETPLCSAKDLDEIKSLQQEVKQKGLRLLTPFRIASLSDTTSTTGK